MKKIILFLLILIFTTSIPVKAESVKLDSYTNGKFLLWDNKKQKIIILPQVITFTNKIKEIMNIDDINIQPSFDFYLDCATKSKINYPYINYYIDFKKQDKPITIILSFTRNKKLYKVVILKGNKAINNSKITIKDIKDKDIKTLFNIIKTCFNEDIKKAYSTKQSGWKKVKNSLGYEVINHSLNKYINRFDIYQHFYTKELYNELFSQSLIFPNFSSFNEFTKFSEIRITNQNDKDIQLLSDKIVLNKNRLSVIFNNLDFTGESLTYGFNYFNDKKPFIYYTKNLENKKGIQIFNKDVQNKINEAIENNKTEISFNNYSLTVQVKDNILTVFIN